MKIAISQKDKTLLDTFKKHVGYDGDIKEYITKDGSYSKIDLWSMNRWHLDLNLNWNIPLKNKTHTLIPPKLKNQDLILAYATGLIDGDGWIHNIGKSFNVGFCGTKEIVLWMQQLWKSIINCKIDFRLNGISKTNYKINVYGSNAQHLKQELELLPITWKLERKWSLIV